MRRCIELSRKGSGKVAPNPMVGAVLVHATRIIGEGFHENYGEAHAEVNCIKQAISNGFENLINQSTIYVSLEPCAHFGKTPPCADLIIEKKIPRVVIGCRDPFHSVNGKGIDKLKSAGVDVVTGILEKECMELNERFISFHLERRPYVILKWAQTADGFISGTSRDGINSNGGSRLFISNDYTNRLVHKWRSEEAAIMVGTNTIAADDPELTTRLWRGRSPVRLVVDMNLQLPSRMKVFDGSRRTIVFNKLRHHEDETLMYYQVTDDVSLVDQVMNALYHLKIQSVMVEGGARLLQSFIDENCWDEARVITNTTMQLGKGLPSPKLAETEEREEISIGSDRIQIFKQTNRN